MAVGGFYGRWTCVQKGGEAGAQRDVISNGYREGLTDSVHNFSRELIAKSLKPLANYLCGRTRYPQIAVLTWSSEAGGGRGYRFFAPQIYYLRNQLMCQTCARHRSTDTLRTDSNYVLSLHSSYAYNIVVHIANLVKKYDHDYGSVDGQVATTVDVQAGIGCKNDSPHLGWQRSIGPCYCGTRLLHWQ